MTLFFVHVTWKSIGVLYYLGTSIMQSSATFKLRGQKILSRQHFFQRQAVWSWPLTIWPENPWGHLPYQVWQLSSKGVKSYWVDIAWSTDRPTGAKQCPLFSKGGIINCTLMQNSNLLTDTFTKTDLKNNSKASLRGHLILA